MGLFDRFKKKNIINFKEIDTVEKEREAYLKGNLETLYLVDPRFGGAEDPGNILYVPIGVSKIKESYDNIIEELLIQDKVKSYKCIPEYRGKSRIACKLTMIASKDGVEVFKQTIEIW